MPSLELDFTNFYPWSFEMASDFPKIITPQFRAVFVFVNKPQPPLQEGQDAKYKVGMLFDKSDPKVKAKLKEIIAVADGMLKERWPKLKASAFQPWLRNGDTDEDLLNGSAPDLFKGMYYAQAKSKDQPGIVDRRRQPLMSADDFYSGCYAIASCALFTYDKAGNKGVGLLLNNLMKVGEGDRLSGKPSAEQDFADVDVPADSTEDDEDALV